jgi:hypothetical protein
MAIHVARQRAREPQSPGVATLGICRRNDRNIDQEHSLTDFPRVSLREKQPRKSVRSRGNGDGRGEAGVDLPLVNEVGNRRQADQPVKRTTRFGF